MSYRVITGYTLSIGLILSAILVGAPYQVFLDIPTAALVFGGTAGLLITLLKGLSSKHITWLGMPASIFCCITGMTVVMIGTISLLVNIKDPSTIGPSMAVCLLGILYTLLFISLVSIPLEDWHNIKRNKFDEITLSRVAWFLFPVASSFFALITMSILLYAVQSLQNGS
jgi:flagellar motor component MotA